MDGRRDGLMGLVEDNKMRIMGGVEEIKKR